MTYLAIQVFLTMEILVFQSSGAVGVVKFLTIICYCVASFRITSLNKCKQCCSYKYQSNLNWLKP